MPYLYYELPNGNLISKKRVDRARKLIAQLNHGYKIIALTESQLFSKGEKLHAIKEFSEKHGCTLSEAKTTIEYLRGE